MDTGTHYIYPPLNGQPVQYSGPYAFDANGYPLSVYGRPNSQPPPQAIPSPSHAPVIQSARPQQQPASQQGQSQHRLLAPRIDPNRIRENTDSSIELVQPMRELPPDQHPPDLQPRNSTYDRVYKYSADGVEEERAEWQTEWASKPMPPPPPSIYNNKEEAIEAAKEFAKSHGYKLSIGPSYRNKAGDLSRVILTCQFGGRKRNNHKLAPEDRVRNRHSHKTGCPMKVRVQKKRFVDEWVLCIICGQHNHALKQTASILEPATYPDLEAALYDWHTAELAKGETDVIHGAVLKLRAHALFVEMPQYRGLPPPELGRKWLDDYRLRHDFPCKPVRSGPPALVDWNDPESAATAMAAVSETLAPSKDDSAFVGVESLFPDGQLIYPVRDFVKAYMSRMDASHDWNHILRVFVLARQLLRQESPPAGQINCDHQTVLLAALLHDVGDHKYSKPGENSENQIAELLLEHGASAELAMKVQLIVKNVSYSNEIKNPRMMKAVLDQHPELAIVQDADRLDAIGAVGIGRTFTYGGAKQPDRGLDGTIEHFQEKLEKLEGMMKTETGKRMARQRTERIQVFRQWWEEENATLL